MTQYCIPKAAGSVADLVTCMCLMLVLIVFLEPTEVDRVVEEGSVEIPLTLWFSEENPSKAGTAGVESVDTQ